MLVAGGAILIALFGALPEPTHNLDQLLELLVRPQFIVWMFGTAVMIALVLALAFFLPRLSRFTQQHHYHLLQRRDSLHQQHHSHHTSPRIRLLTGMCFGFASAILSAHTLLLAKSAVELILTSLPFTRHSDNNGNAEPTNQFTHYQSYLILIALVAFALLQLYFLHRGLKLASTSVLYPFVFCVYNIVAILDGLIYFKQTDRLPVLHAGLIALGTVILLAGVLALSWRLDEQGLQQERDFGIEQPVVPTAQISGLAPGLGLVEDTVTESPSGTDDVLTDEERVVGRNNMSESTPLLARRSSTRTGGTVGFDLGSGARGGSRPSSGYGTTKRNRRGSRGSIMTTPRRTRFGGSVFERENIWRELMDDKEALVSPVQEPQIRQKRRRTIVGMPTRQDRPASEADSNDGSNEGEGAVSQKGKMRRTKTTPGREASGSSQEAQNDGEEGAAWKKRRRREVRPNDARTVSSPLLGLQRMGSFGGRPGGRDGRRVVDWVGGLFVSNHDVQPQR